MANRAVEAIAGRPQSKIVGRPAEEIFAPAVAARLRANDRSVAAAGGAAGFEEEVPAEGEPLR